MYTEIKFNGTFDANLTTGEMAVIDVKTSTDASEVTTKKAKFFVCDINPIKWVDNNNKELYFTSALCKSDTKKNKDMKAKVNVRVKDGKPVAGLIIA